MSAPTTKPGRLSDVARELVLPSGLASSEWPSIRQRCDTMGVRLDQWQADLVRGALAKRADGKYAATVGGIAWSLPRQVGKTFTVGAMLFALCANNPGLLVLWTAHHTRTSAETFGSMQSMAKRPRVAPFIERVLRGAGTEAIVFRNGSRILFGARDQGFGLGFAAVDAIVFDEAQRLADRTRVDMVPATNRAHNPAGALLFYIGTPPRPTDQGDAFAAMRQEALAGEGDDTFYVELGAAPDAGLDDHEQWARANPSFPTHTPIESMLRMRKHLGDDDSWRREALGIWDPERMGALFDMARWNGEQCFDPDSKITGKIWLGLEVAQDLSWSCVNAAGLREDGLWHVQVVDSRPGTSWVADAAKDMPGIRNGIAVSPSSPAGSLIKQLAAAKVKVLPVTPAEYAQACGSFHRKYQQGELKHLGQPEMDTAVKCARKRQQGDSWVFDRRFPDVDITPLAGAVVALRMAETGKPRNAGNGRVRVME